VLGGATCNCIRNLAGDASNGRRSNISCLRQFKSNYKADMIHDIKRRKKLSEEIHSTNCNRIRNLARNAQMVKKSNISYLREQKTNSEADIIHETKRRMILQVERFGPQANKSAVPDAQALKARPVDPCARKRQYQ
jgi:hypothetical protein